MDSDNLPPLPEELKAYLDLLDGRSRRFAILRLGLDVGQPRTIDQAAKILGITLEEALSIDATTKEALGQPVFDQTIWTSLLQDATLLDIVVDWSARSLAVRFQKTDKEEVLIVAHGLEALRLTHIAPYTPSQAVLEVGVLEGLRAGKRVVIRLRSGDQIEFLAERISDPSP